MTRILWPLAVCLCIFAPFNDTAAHGNDEFQEALNILTNASKHQGNELSKAWLTVVRSPSAQLPNVMVALDKSDDVGINWVNSAVDAILSRDKSASVEPVEEIVLAANHKAVTRKTALDVLTRMSAKRADSITMRLLNDPVAEFRHPAIAKLIDEAQQFVDDDQKEKALEVYQTALAAARDERQVQAIAKAIESLGQKVDLQKHFGYLTQWQIIGPFDNTDAAGFDKAYPPEKLTLDTYDQPNGIFGSETLTGKDGKVGWKGFKTEEPNGNVDLNKVLEKQPEVVAYGATVINSSRPRDVQLRLRIQNAHKVWLNGKLVASQPIGHTGNAFDQYIVDAPLKQGKNLLVVKSCQIKPPMAMAFFETWHFCVRVTDKTGGAVVNQETTL